LHNPKLEKSTLAENGLVSQDEYVFSGDYLTSLYTQWAWRDANGNILKEDEDDEQIIQDSTNGPNSNISNSSANKIKPDPNLPKNKQYLVSKNRSLKREVKIEILDGEDNLHKLTFDNGKDNEVDSTIDTLGKDTILTSNNINTEINNTVNRKEGDPNNVQRESDIDFDEECESKLNYNYKMDDLMIED